MTHHSIEEALDAFIQERLSERLDNLDLQQEVEDAMDNYDWRTAVEDVTDDLGLASTDSVEELEEAVSRIRERQEEGAAARDAQNHAIGRIKERLAHLDARLDAHASTLDDQAVQADRLAERIAALEAVMLGQVADEDPGEVEELREMLDAAHAERQAQEHQAQPDRLAEAMNAQSMALDLVGTMVFEGDQVPTEAMVRAKDHAAAALQALLDAALAQDKEDQA